MLLKIDDNELIASLKNIHKECRINLGKPLDGLFKKDYTVVVNAEFAITEFYEASDKVSVFKYVNKPCNVKAVLEVKGILLTGDKARICLYVSNASVRMVPTEF